MLYLSQKPKNNSAKIESAKSDQSKFVDKNL